MNKPPPVTKPACNLSPADAEGFDALAELALDMYWSWNHATDEVWRQLDAALWELTHNPWIVLRTVSRDRLNKMLADHAFRKKINDLVQSKNHAEKTAAWFQQHHHLQNAFRLVPFFDAAHRVKKQVADRRGAKAVFFTHVFD